MFKSIQKIEFTDYCFVAALVAVSGFPFFMVSQFYFTLLFVIVTFFYLKRSKIFDFRSLYVLIPFMSIEIIQFVLIHPHDPILMVGTFIRLAAGLFTVKLVGKKFTDYYINIITFFAGLSFFFFIPCLLFHSFFTFFVNHICTFFASPFEEKSGFYIVWPTIWVYTFHDCILQELRNPGPFWEPGLFSIYINLALMFNLIKEKKIVTRKNIILILALLSTFSTGGYVPFFVLVYAFYMVNQSMAKKIIFSAVALPLVITIYYSADFLSSKIEQNISMAGTTTSSRFGSAMADINDFSTSPLIGWGRGQTRYGGRVYAFFTEDQHRNNSVTDLLATYGIFIFIMYFAWYYKGLHGMCVEANFQTGFAGFALLVILMLGFSQSIFLKPFFYSLLFIQYNYPKRQYGNNLTLQHEDID